MCLINLWSIDAFFLDTDGRKLNLNCDTLEIYGEFTGNGEVRELQVCKGGKVKGSLSYNTIVVEVGAIISGPMKPIDKDPVLLIENK